MNSSSCQKPLLANSPEVKNSPLSPVSLSRVLLRVRMLYYLRQEVIGDQAEKILEGADSRWVHAWVPPGRDHLGDQSPHHGWRGALQTYTFSASPFLHLECSVCPTSLGT